MQLLLIKVIINELIELDQFDLLSPALKTIASPESPALNLLFLCRKFVVHQLYPHLAVT